MSKDDDHVALGIHLVLWPFLAPLNIIYDGYVLSWLWEWFLVPMFDVQSLPLWYAAGLCLIVTHVAPAPHRGQMKPLDMVGCIIGHALVNPTIVLGIGYVLHLLARGQ